MIDYNMIYVYGLLTLFFVNGCRLDDACQSDSHKE
jgi:hypothetical protein